MEIGNIYIITAASMYSYAYIEGNETIKHADKP